MPLSKAFAWSETQTASFRIWTQVTDSIYDNDNKYTKHLLSVVAWTNIFQ